MRCFTEDLENGFQDGKETLVIMSKKEAQILMESLKFKIDSLPKIKTRKERKLYEELENKWCIYGID